MLSVRLFSLFFKGVSCYVDHALVVDPTPRSILLRQIELHAIIKKKRTYIWLDRWEDLGGGDRIQMYYEILKEQKNLKYFIL